MKSEKIKLKDYVVSPCSRSEVKDFIEKHHYSHSINGVKTSYCFTLKHDGILLGAMLFGEVAMKGQSSPYGDEKDVLELRRLVLIDETPRNCESFFIGAALRWLKKNTDKTAVVSYADPAYGHEGIVYKASNFEFLGFTSPTKVVVINGKEYHDRALRTKYKGEYKPFVKKLRQAVENGEAQFETRPPKRIYLYRLRKSRTH